MTKSAYHDFMSSRLRNKDRTGLLIVVVLVVTAAVLAVAVVSNQESPPRDLPQVHADRADNELLRLQEDLNLAVMDKRPADVVLGDLRAFVERFPDRADAWRALGQGLAYAEDPEGAYDAFSTSLELDDGHAEIAVLAGTFAKGLERFDESEQWYLHAVQLQPDLISHRRHLAALYEHTGRLNQAEAALREALSRSPNHVEVQIQLAHVLETNGKPQQAMAMLEQAVGRSALLEPERQRIVTVHYAKMQLDQGLHEQAFEALEALPASQQFDHDVIKQLARCWVIQNQPQLAAERYDKLLILNPGDERAAIEAARYWIMTGQIDKAQAALTMLRRINPRAQALMELTKQLEAIQ